jgi:hypothetical protein
MTSRMGKKSVVKFAYVAYRETCRYTCVGGYFPFSPIDDFHVKWRRVD